MSVESRPSTLVSDASSAARESRLQFTPSYALVGVYRLATDPNLYRPVWDKVKHGTRRGGFVGLGWTVLTFRLQRAFVRFFLINSPRVTGLSHESLFGYKVPLDIVTYATVMFMSSQVEMILTFFLSRNLRIARERAWDQTVKSRGKGPQFWGPYVEEWRVPPQVDEGRRWWYKWVRSGLARYLIRRVLLAPLSIYPFVGIALSSWLKATQTAGYLHKPYFAAKKMTSHQTAVFMEEKKWDYQAFGFVASLLESLPIVGLALTISNRIGAAMWAHDLEKQQHLFASGKLQPRSPRSSHVTHQGEPTEFGPKDISLSPPIAVQSATGNASGDASDKEPTSRLRMAGSWEPEENS